MTNRTKLFFVWINNSLEIIIALISLQSFKEKLGVKKRHVANEMVGRINLYSHYKATLSMAPTGVSV